MNPAIDRLLAWVENPVLKQSFVEAVRSREPLVARSLPPALLPAAVLLSAVAQEWGEAPIVDDWRWLYEAAKQAFNEKVCPLSHPDSYIVSAIVFQGADNIADHPQAEYIGVAYRELTGTFDAVPKKKRRAA